MKKIESIRMTTNVEKKGIKLRNNRIAVSSFSILAQYFSAESLNEIFLANKIDFFEEKVRRPNWEDESWKMRKLVLDEKPLKKLLKTGQFDILMDKIQDEEEQISSLTFSIKSLQISEEKLKGLFRWIKAFRSLEKINLKLHPKNLNFGLLCQAIKRHSGSQSLLLELQCPDQGLDLLRNALKPLVSLQYLSLDFTADSLGISNEGLSHLKNALEGLNCLQYLSLGFKGSKDISDKGIQEVTSSIRNLVNLQTLALGFEECKQISDQSLHHLETALSPLKSLRKLAVRLLGCENISEQGIEYLNKALTPLLNSLSLNLPFPKNFKDQGFSHLFANALKALVNLQNLSLDFGNTSDDTLDSMKNTLSSILSLENLSLVIYGFRSLSKKKLADFLYTLKFLTKMRQLSLEITNIKGNADEWLVPLKDALQSLRYLEALSLRFGSNSSQNNFQDKDLVSLGGALMSLLSLKFLHLDLKRASQMTDQGMFSLSEGLKLLVSLENFSLNLRRCEKVSDKGLEKLAQAIELMKDLQHLSLDFGHCSKISLEGMNKIKDVLPNLGFLQHLSLDFTDCYEKFPTSGKSVFIDAIKYIPELSLKACGSEALVSEDHRDFEKIRRL